MCAGHASSGTLGGSSLTQRNRARGAEPRALRWRSSLEATPDGVCRRWLKGIICPEKSVGEKSAL